MYRVLIVEESRTQAIQLESLLEQEGWAVVCASTGEEALAELLRHQPDLVILDGGLRQMRSDEFCRRLREDADTLSIPVLVRTMDERQSADPAEAETGADDFVPKTADPEVLLARVRHLLERTQDRTATLDSTDPHFRQSRLLAIDDSSTYLEFLDGELQQDGYDLHKAASGELGLTRIDSEHFDCVLVDLMMPEMDGIEVCRQIDARRRGTDNPIGILMLTAREGKEELSQALEAGADDFVSKSSDMAIVRGRIRALLRRRFYQEENQRIHGELKQKELEAELAQIQRQAAEARAELADELAQTAAELKRSNDELQQFAHIVSHDLNEPLRSVSGLSKILQKRLGEKLEGREQELFQHIIEGAARMKALLDDLLELSRVGTRGKAFEPVNCSELVAEVLADLSVAVQESGAVVTHDELPTVTADPTQLRQLLQNLIANATKFRGEKSPRVHLSANRLQTTDHRPGAEDGEAESEGGSLRSECWEFRVRDNGIGIDGQDFDRVFTLFQRLHTRDAYPGTGLGLALCKRIVERHGGRIWIESEPGEGSTFHFTLQEK